MQTPIDTSLMHVCSECGALTECPAMGGITAAGDLVGVHVRQLVEAARAVLPQLCDTSTRGLKEADDLREALRVFGVKC